MRPAQEYRMRSPVESPANEAIPSFLLKTYEILEKDIYGDIICWTRNGEGFIVRKIKEFSENVLPIYFRHSNYTSFVRQLNMYDFHKTRQENQENAFKNVLFRRGQKHLLKDIQRKDYKKNKDGGRQLDRTVEGTTHQLKTLTLTSTSSRNKENLTKISGISQALERKAVALAQLKELPSSQQELLKLLDLLFDAKRLQRELFYGVQGLVEEPRPQEALTPVKEVKQWPATESKVGSTEKVKEEHVQASLPTCPTLMLMAESGL